MGLETASQIWELVPANPLGSDPRSEGDNHIRMVKQCIQNSFPGMSAPWKTSSPINAGEPVAPSDLVTLQYFQNNQVPMIGWPFIWLLPTLPNIAGLLFADCDGQALSRATYSALFAMYGVTYGSGDGTTTFNMPNLRGLGLRVQDRGAGVDPDAAARTNRGDGTTGDNVGTKQQDAFKSHDHTSAANGLGVRQSNTGNYQVPLSGGNTGFVALPFEGAAETRMKNIYIRMVMRIK